MQEVSLYEFKRMVRVRMNRSFRAFSRMEIQKYYRSEECQNYIKERYDRMGNLNARAQAEDVAGCLRFMY